MSKLSVLFSLLLSTFVVQSTTAWFLPVHESQCSTEYGSRSLRSVPSYTDTTTLTWVSTATVSITPTVTVSAAWSQLTVTRTQTLIGLWDAKPAEDMLPCSDHSNPSSPSRTDLDDVASSPFMKLAPTILPDPASPLYAYPTLQTQLRVSKGRLGHESSPQYPQFIHCSRSITLIIRTTATVKMEPSTLFFLPPSVKTITTSKTVYSASMKPTPVTIKVPVTVYTPSTLVAVPTRRTREDGEL